MRHALLAAHAAWLWNSLTANRLSNLVDVGVGAAGGALLVLGLLVLGTYSTFGILDQPVNSSGLRRTLGLFAICAAP